MIPSVTPDTFAAALRAGRGRAYVHIQKYGLSGVAATVLAACLHNQAYDPQCEASRAAWLFGMFQGAKESAQFSSAIVAALEHETNTWDLQQLCELTALLSKTGNEQAHGALRQRVLRQARAETDLWVGAAALVALEGVSAVVDLARCYGRV